MNLHLEIIMTSTKPHTDTQRPDASRKAPSDPSSPGNTGGAPAAEEDIGTEGAGTEPRDSADVARETDSRSGKARGDRNA